MYSLYLTIALLPLTLYAAFLARANCRRSPFMITRGKNAFLLGFGLSGIFLTGIAPFLLPIQAILNFGIFAWELILTLYFLLIAYFQTKNRSLQVRLYSIDPVKFQEIINASNTANPSETLRNSILFFPEMNAAASVEISSFFQNATLIFFGTVFSSEEKKRILKLTAEKFDHCGSKNLVRSAIFTAVFFGLFIALVYNASHISGAMFQEILLNFKADI